MEALYLNIEHLFPDCDGHIINNEKTGEEVCNACGVVFDENPIDTTSENGSVFSVEDWNNKKHVGPPMKYGTKNYQLNTLSKKDVRKHTIKTRNKSLERAHKIDSRKSYKDKCFQNAKIEIERMCGKLNIKEPFITDALRLFADARKSKILVGRSLEPLIAAILYYICKKNDITHSIKTITQESAMKAKKPGMVFKQYKLLVERFPFVCKPSLPQNHIPRFTSELGISWMEPIVQKAFTHLNLRTGRDPNGIAAGMIYVIAKLLNVPITYPKLSKVAGVIEMTIQNRAKEIKSLLGIPNLLGQIYFSKLGLNSIEHLVFKILKTRSYSSRYKAGGIAAGAIYSACKIAGVKINYKQLIEITNVSESTIRRRYKEFMVVYNENKHPSESLNLFDNNLMQTVEISA